MKSLIWLFLLLGGPIAAQSMSTTYSPPIRVPVPTPLRVPLGQLFSDCCFLDCERCPRGRRYNHCFRLDEKCRKQPGPFRGNIGDLQMRHL